ncbi:MAG: 5-bromo-4-chloroindolyl phosphate hydrolysis family protein [Pseudomonadota bacterium]
MSEFSKRIGSKVSAASQTTSGGYVPSRSGRPWLLYVLPLFVFLPLTSGIIAGNAMRTLGSIAAMALFYCGAIIMRRGIANAVDYAGRTFTKAPAPLKLGAAILTGLGVFSLSFVADGTSLFLAILYAVIAGGATVLAYGFDPRADKGVDQALADRAGIKTEDVITTIDEANAKINAIEAAARPLDSRELKERIAHIVTRARSIVANLERDPSDIRRARRFLVTYLDGARDVVHKYAGQQQQGSSPELAASFRHVLETIEQVFDQQEAELKKNDTLDLEVQIEVLKTQLEREGVH